MDDVTRGVGENKVVDVGVRNGGVGVLVEAIEKEGEAEDNGEREYETGGGE